MPTNQPMLLVDRAPPTALFPERLHVALTDLEQQGLSHIVSWQPHGRAFRVHKRDAFVEKILPRYGGALTTVFRTVAYFLQWNLKLLANLCCTLFSTYSWFKQSSFPSFQRQLNIYGFVRIASGTIGLGSCGVLHASTLNTFHCVLTFCRAGQGCLLPRKVCARTTIPGAGNLPHGGQRTRAA
jgi:HSF-type DNA-binding